MSGAFPLFTIKDSKMAHSVDIVMFGNVSNKGEKHMFFKQGEELPLKGLKVIDFATVIAAPSCARIFADLGADVIKVEAGVEGDWILRIQTAGTPTLPEEHPIFALCNANKKHISLNLKTGQGYDVMMRLLKTADVLITNIRYASLERLKMDYATIKEKFPSLIYAHFSGYGYNGPDHAIAAYDVSAFWGRTSALLEWLPEDTKCLPNPSYGFGDLSAAGMLFGAIMVALYKRMVNGKGTMVTGSLLHMGIWASSNHIIPAKPHYGKHFPDEPDQVDVLSRSYRCKDGKWITLLGLARLHPWWVRFCKAVGLGYLLEDPKYKDYASIVENNAMPELHRIFERKMLEKTRDEWKSVFDAADLACGKVCSAEEVIDDKDAWANGYLAKTTYMNGAEVVMTTIPMQFSEYGIKAPTGSKPIGYDTDEVLREYGYSEEDIQALREAGAVYGI